MGAKDLGGDDAAGEADDEGADRGRDQVPVHARPRACAWRDSGGAKAGCLGEFALVGGGAVGGMQGNLKGGIRGGAVAGWQ